jgi:hypothetical protein
MKKLLLLLLAVATIQSTIAQTSDKKWGIGGGAGVYVEKTVKLTT